MQDAIVIIPTYNEIENIEAVIDAVFDHSDEVHILVVDDNSPDKTAHKVELYQSKYLGRLFLLKRNGKQGLGDLNSITKEIDKVINDLEKKNYTESTSQSQKKILSRMLDSQTSMTQRGVDDKRKSETAEQVTLDGIIGMPKDLGQRQSFIINAMNKALNSGYSRDYQNMIRRYFNSLNQTQRGILSDTIQNKLPIEIIE